VLRAALPRPRESAQAPPSDQHFRHRSRGFDLVRSGIAQAWRRNGSSARRIFLLPHCVIEHSVHHHNGVRGVISIEHRLDGERLLAELCAGRAPGTVPDEFPPRPDPLDPRSRPSTRSTSTTPSGSRAGPNGRDRSSPLLVGTLDHRPTLRRTPWRRSGGGVSTPRSRGVGDHA
jgi:hypothetical protein